MGGDCSTYGREETCVQGFGGETWGKKSSWKTKGQMDIEMDLEEVGCDYLDGIDLAQDRGRWRALVNAVMNCRVP